MDIRAEDIIPRNEWPYGAARPIEDSLARERLLTWARSRGLRYSPLARCLHWIAKGRCGVSYCRDGHSSRAWMDHITGWTCAGKPALLLCQPYHIDDETRQSIAQAAVQFGLQFAIKNDGWYGHGTRAIELSPIAKVTSIAKIAKIAEIPPGGNYSDLGDYSDDIGHAS